MLTAISNKEITINGKKKIFIEIASALSSEIFQAKLTEGV